MNKSDYKRARSIARQLQAMDAGAIPITGNKKTLENELKDLYTRFKSDTDIHSLHEMLCLEYYYFLGFSHPEIMRYLYGNGLSINYSANRIYNVFKRKKQRSGNTK